MQSPEVKPLRWGWIAVLHFESGGGWMKSTEAARRSGVSTTKLRRWAEKGVISVIHVPGRPRNYYIAELDFLAEWEVARRKLGMGPLDLPALTGYIQLTLES
ncbi:MerR family transcriptional regulator [Actinomadura sp. KC216]|nr:MerR family transcriptional regulator [Actinomadura sp. KC216]